MKFVKAFDHIIEDHQKVKAVEKPYEPIPGKLDELALATLANKGYGCMSCPAGGIGTQTGPAAYIKVAGYSGIPSYEEFKNENIYL